MANNKSDFVAKVVSDAVASMLKPQPAPKATVDGTMFAIRRAQNGFLVSVIPEGAGAQPTMLVFSDWDAMIEQLRQMMFPQPPIGEGH